MSTKRSRLALPHKEYKKLCDEVHKRDGWKCRVKGCKTRNNLHCHHIRYRSQQGDDTRQNMITVCSTCHDAIHERYILIRQGDGLELEINADKPVRWELLDGWLPGKRL